MGVYKVELSTEKTAYYKESEKVVIGVEIKESRFEGISFASEEVTYDG